MAASTDRILSMLDEKRIKGTFFVLGWVADKVPQLVKRIASLGHEVACHGYSHELIYRQTPSVFAEETRRSKTLLEEWRLALEALSEGDPERLGRKVDWVTKRLMIERYQAKHDLPLASPRVALLDLAYHDVNRNRGLYYRLGKAGNVERVCADREINRAMREPPQTTRAKLRGDFIRQAKAKRREPCSVIW